MADSCLIDGNCEICRRKNYCSTECKKHRAKWKRGLYNAVMSATGMDRVLDVMSTPAYDAHETVERIAKMEGILE